METRAYRSKIGRLPYAIRHELCERMLDGAPAADLCAWLNDLPPVRLACATFGGGAINPQNVTDWRKTGYADWLKDRERTDHLRTLADLASHISAQVGGDPTAVGARLLTGKLLDVMQAADDGDIADLAKTIGILRAGENDAAKVALAREKQDLAVRQLALDRERFQFQVASTALKIFEDRQAAEIATSSAPREDRIKRLLEYMAKQEQEPAP
jgi:hypothetical protein